jgi:hypothetical protein
LPGATIDHLVAFTVFLVALLLFTSLFSQNLQSAILYQRNKQVTIEASDLLDSLALYTGYPRIWGRTNSTPTAFGLQDPTQGGYSISPFSLMRLMSFTGQPIYYSKTGLWYSNVTMASGGFLFVPYNTCVNYTTAATLLGVNGSYGFQLKLTPIVSISMTTLNADHLRISVNVMGPSMPLANAYVAYNLICTSKLSKQSGCPTFQVYNGTTNTYANGSAILDFPSLTTAQAFSLIANVHLGGLYGTGYFIQNYINNKNYNNTYVIPMVKSFDNGNGTATILIAHSYDVHYFGPPEAAISYNATFLVLASDAALHPILVGNGTINGKINYGAGKPYGTIVIPNTNPGILVITFNYGNSYGISLLPWGIGDLGVAVTFGATPPTNNWIAVDVREVMVGGESYQMKIALWSLTGYQAKGPLGGVGR